VRPGYRLRANPLILGIALVGVGWATGGGAINLISDRLGGLVFAGERGISGDSAVAALYFAAGLGLFLGMMIARRVGAHMEMMGSTVGFIGWTLVVQGVLFAGIGLILLSKATGNGATGLTSVRSCASSEATGLSLAFPTRPPSSKHRPSLTLLPLNPFRLRI
jgi:hypothetical protein